MYKLCDLALRPQALFAFVIVQVVDSVSLLWFDSRKSCDVHLLRLTPKVPLLA